MKTVKTVLALVASLGIALATAIGPAWAQPGPGFGEGPGMMGGGPGMMGGDWQQRWERMQQRHTQRMQDLKDQLNLKPEQQAAWQAFIDAHDTWLKSMQSNWQSWKEANTTPKRFEQMVAAAQDNVKNLEKLNETVSVLYNTLDAQQKATLDRFTAKPGRFKGKGQNQ
ncbi:MAG: Spy/CpxP family protein refolding chaperone [Candidatus Competibacteraceae bacterium]